MIPIDGFLEPDQNHLLRRSLSHANIAVVG
jgi:hypothetical protein